MFDQKRVSQERVIGISFVDILIQAIFVLLVALFVGYVDPTVKVQMEQQSEYGQVGKDLCHKLNKDSVEACREYIDGKRLVVQSPQTAKYDGVCEHICRLLGATSADDCRRIADKELARLRPCLKPINEFSVPATLMFSLKSPSEIEFLGFSSNFTEKLKEDGDTVKMSRVADLERSRGTTLTPQQVQSNFDFIREQSCYHVVHVRRPGPFSDADLRDALAVFNRLRQPIQ